MSTPNKLHLNYSRLKIFIASPAFNAIFWVVLGTGSLQAIRFISNLILTRLLFPEAFGIMAIVYAIIIGFTLISDVGIREAVINSKRANDESFMRTAWTVELLKSCLIALLIIAIAYPASLFYEEPILFPVICICAIAIIIKGFRSIALMEYDKRMDVKAQIKCELLGLCANISVIMIWALIWPSIWALVAGYLVGSIIEVIFSYIFFKGHHSKLAWDKEAVLSMFHYGKWIIISSTLSYITMQASPLIMGGFISMGELGKYSLAAGLAGIITLFAMDLSRRVLHPYFRQSLEGENGFRAVRNMRWLFNGSLCVACIGLAIIGDKIIFLIYDDRYAAAGWMLQILAFGQIGRCMTGTLLPFLLAKEDSFSQMTVSACSALFLVVLLVIGGHLYGSVGVIIAYSLAGLLTHPVVIFLASRHGYRTTLYDIGLMLISLTIIGIGWVLFDSAVLTELSTLNWL